MFYYNLDIDKVLKELNTSKKGLSEVEVTKRLKKDGQNKLAEAKKRSSFSKFIDQFRDLMIIFLIISAVVSFIISLVKKEPFTDSIIIIAIVILNAILGFIQERKADKAIDALKKMQVKKVKVKRDGAIYQVNSENIVKGDILVLEAGDSIPADARIIYAVSLKVDESSLTGESMPVEKNTNTIKEQVPLASRFNMLYSGTNIVYGKCEVVVCDIGMNTEFGLIESSLKTEEKEITPLQKRIDGISKFLSVIIVLIIMVMFIVGSITGMDTMEVVMLSISLAVAAIPEGLPAVITIVLSLGMSDLAKKNAIVRKMTSVETLGCTEIICSDKTGTITQNKMNVREIYCDKKINKIDELDEDNIIFKVMALNNDAVKTKKEFLGDPTEIALYECASIYLDVENIRGENKRVGELPFDSERKMMSTVNKCDGKYTMYTKGSFDSIINACSHILENNKVVKLTKVKKAELKEMEKKESNKAYRVIAYAYKNVGKDYKLDLLNESDLIFVGFSAMIDPPREDVKEAISYCKSAHIKPIMITGDSLDTATSIAKEIGILQNKNEAILGTEIDKMSPNDLKKNVTKYSVYARVSPMNKLAIVSAWQEAGKVVAMTGDGVNDAPALKKADIGVGMGKTGTEVSKGVSDIILADDSFSTIVTAVKEGRRIYDNIRKVLIYLLTGNISEVLVVFIGMMCGLEIFLPIQLLYINLITDGIPAIALAFEREEEDVMERDVRKKDSSFFTPFLIAKMAISAILKTATILIVYFANTVIFNEQVGCSMAFLTLILSEMIFAYSCRNLKQSMLEEKLFANGYLNKSMLCLGLVQVIIFVTPLKNLFGIVTLNLWQTSYCLIIIILMFLIDEISKSILVKFFKD